MQLRPYQSAAFDSIRACYARGVRRALYVAPTGSGKTVTFAYIARNAAAKNNRVCIGVHRRELLKQTSEKLEHSHGRISAGLSERRDELIQVASVQTLVNRLDAYQFDLIIIDEAHHSTASTYMRIIEANPRARVLGVTATPVRLSGTGLGDLFQEMIIGPSVRELTAAGMLAPAEIYAPMTIDLVGVHRARGDYAKKGLALASDKPHITGCAVAHYKKYSDGLPAIAFCVSVQHAEHVAEKFRAAGYVAKRVDGAMDQRERDAAIAGLGNGSIQVLTSCDLISEGVDVPVVACGILLRPTQSLGLYLQQVGRILRPSPGKTAAIILDHAGNTLRHGLPCEDREWSLERGAVPRARALDEEDDPHIRQCSQCFNIHEWASTCPACGFEYPLRPRIVEEREGELLRMNEARAAANAAVAVAGSVIELAETEYAAGRKPGWAIHAWRAAGRELTRDELKAYANRVAKLRGYKSGWVHYFLKLQNGGMKRETVSN